MSSDKQVSFDSNFAFDHSQDDARRISGNVVVDVYKSMLVRREKLIVNQGDFIGEAVLEFGKLDSLKTDGKLDKDELVKATTSSDKKTAKLASLLLSNTELIAADGQNITLKDLANLQTQKAGILQERKLLTAMNSPSFDKTYNAANTNKADDLTVVELTARMQAGKLTADERSKVSYILSNFEIIDKATGNDGALSEQDVRAFVAGRSARIVDVQSLDDKFDTQTRKVWYEKAPVRVLHKHMTVPAPSTYVPPPRASSDATSGPADAPASTEPARGAAAMGAEGSARANFGASASDVPHHHSRHHH